jgi:hypothetical protein
MSGFGSLVQSERRWLEHKTVQSAGKDVIAEKQPQHDLVNELLRNAIVNGDSEKQPQHDLELQRRFHHIAPERRPPL